MKPDMILALAYTSSPEKLSLDFFLLLELFISSFREPFTSSFLLSPLRPPRFDETVLNEGSRPHYSLLMRSSRQLTGFLDFPITPLWVLSFRFPGTSVFSCEGPLLASPYSFILPFFTFGRLPPRHRSHTTRNISLTSIYHAS